MRKVVVYLLPLVVFLVVAGFLMRGLWLNPREIPSPLIDKPAPSFSLAQLARPESQFSPADMKGQVWLLNVWASWCVACRQEHPLLVDLAGRKAVRSSGSTTRTSRMPRRPG